MYKREEPKKLAAIESVEITTAYSVAHGIKADSPSEEGKQRASYRGGNFMLLPPFLNGPWESRNTRFALVHDQCKFAGSVNSVPDHMLLGTMQYA